MQAPKRKTSKSKRNMRRSHHALVAGSLHACPNCGEAVKSHCVCKACGQYKGKQIIKTAEEQAAA